MPVKCQAPGISQEMTFIFLRARRGGDFNEAQKVIAIPGNRFLDKGPKYRLD